MNIFDNNEFLGALSENWNSIDNISIPIIQNKDQLFIPFDLNESHSQPLSDCDPDLQYYNNEVNSTLYSCDYFLEDSCNIRIKRDRINYNSFSMLHANIRSAVKNLRNFDAYLENFDHKFKILALTESWPKDHNSALYNIEGYNAEHRCRTIRGGGGFLCIFTIL